MNIVIMLANEQCFYNNSLPKQFVKLNYKSLFLYSLETFANDNNIDKVILVVNHSYMDFCLNQIRKDFSNNLINKIDVISSDLYFNESLYSAYKFINQKYQVNNNDVILIHEATRIFINQELINNSINLVNKNNDRVIVPIIANDLNNINSYIYQTPITMKFLLFKQLMNNINSNNLFFKNLDIKEFLLSNNIDLFFTLGSISNFKVNTNRNLLISSILINKE